MQQGIVTAFLAHKHKRVKRKIAVLEVDEANVKMVTKLLHPSVFVLTNIFRDQMDRYGEIYTTYEKIVNGIKLAPDATIIANGDASIFSSVKLPNKRFSMVSSCLVTSQKMTLRQLLTQMVCFVLNAITSCTTMKEFTLT